MNYTEDCSEICKEIASCRIDLDDLSSTKEVHHGLSLLQLHHITQCIITGCNLIELIPITVYFLPVSAFNITHSDVT